MFGTSDPCQQALRELSVLPPKGQPYSVTVPGSQVAGRSAVYRHWKFVDRPLLERLVPEITTAHESFEASASRYPKNKCLGHRPYDPVSKTWGNYVWQDYETVQKRRKNFGSGLVNLHKQAGIHRSTQYGVGLWCQNRPEWQITDLACMSQGLYSVSLYDTLGPDAVEYIISHTELGCVVTTLPHVITLLKLKPRLPNLKMIIVFEPLSAGELPGESKGDILRSMAADLGVTFHSLGDVEALGEKEPIPYNPPTPDSIATINYTSGTTGNPKGVVLSHRATMAATAAAQANLGNHPSYIYFSFLPLAHIYQRLGEIGAFSGGASIGYFHGNVLELVDDMKLLRPHIFGAVPRLYNRFGNVIKEASVKQPGFKGTLSRYVVDKKLAAIRDKNNPTNTHPIYDRLWSNKVAAAIGLDRATAMVSGASPLDPMLHEFLRIAIPTRFSQGYGLTETYAVTICQAGDDLSTGNCGSVSACAEACLADVPDMEYYATDKPHPRGELLLRGNNHFTEYYRNPEETAKAIDDQGWFHTGDICSIDELGRFKIIDRRKNVLKLAQGEYISPERIENVYLANCPWLATAYVHGDSHQAFLVAIFGVAPDLFAPFASKVLGEKIDHLDAAQLQRALKDKRVEKAVIKELDRVGKVSRFNNWEKVRNVRFFVDPFTIENELLTPTLKLKRPQAAKRYKADIDAMYEEALLEEESRKTKAKL